MARTRRGRAAELSESWDDVAQEDYSDGDDYTPSPDELEDERETRRNTRLNRANGDAEPELACEAAADDAGLFAAGADEGVVEPAAGAGVAPPTGAVDAASI